MQIEKAEFPSDAGGRPRRSEYDALAQALREMRSVRFKIDDWEQRFNIARATAMAMGIRGVRVRWSVRDKYLYLMVRDDE